MDRPFLRLYSMQFFYVLTHIFGWTLAPLYFVKMGYSFLDIALYFALSFATSLLAIMILKNSRSDKLMRAGLILKAVIFVITAYIYVKPLLFISAILWGAMTIFYWVPMNIHFFKFRTAGKHARHAGLFFVLWPILGTIIPAIAGIAAEKYGMAFVFFLAAAIMVPAILLSFGMKQSEAIYFDFKKFTANTKGVKTIIFLQGIWEGMDWLAVPLVTMSFISGAVDFGAFYSYLGFFGIIAFFIAGRASDKMKKRAVFLYPITVAMAVSTILSGISATFFAWGIFRGAVSFLVNIFSPFAMTVVIDTSKSIEDSMISREFFLCFGRALGTMIVALMLIMSIPIQNALIVSGAILFLHPFFLKEKKKDYHVEI